MTTALITGSTSGIGAAFARRLASDGYDLVLVARREQQLREQAAELHDRHRVEAEVLRADLAEDDGITAVEKRLGDTKRPVDLLVNNAGYANRGTYLDVPLTDELRMLKVHCEAVLRLTTAAVDPMKERGNGGVISVASTGAFLPRGTYGASKAWIVQFMLGAPADFKARGVRMMAVCPGYVRTQFHERAGMVMAEVPNWMWLEPEQVVSAALKDFAKGKALSVPALRYKAMLGMFKMAPRGAMPRLSPNHGRYYGNRNEK
ncbi:SDR family oxidoreductase [Streptomyces sp. XD-27]|uniref:SDR family NAD(P)-dependent oxidoreductase n=1 Tax=Streptomyces sp. XD-27 TaxID=3062779 RepID=UPI0026F4530D|nr:SDR family oxidoreductase [Streptomyces sp. XD-27]WKX72056.1 SDR family oxidoreductase [Streptomyces sp. XD-27]